MGRQEGVPAAGQYEEVLHGGDSEHRSRGLSQEHAVLLGRGDLGAAALHGL